MNIRLSRQATLTLFAAGLLTACGGGGTHGGTTAPVQRAPEITNLQNKTTPQDTPGIVAFNIADADSTADNVSVTVTSSNQDLIPNSSLALTGTSAARSIHYTPLEAAVGSTVLTVMAKDLDGNTSSRDVTLNVNAVTVSFLDTTQTAFAAGETDTPVTVNGKTFTPDADDSTSLDTLVK